MGKELHLVISSYYDPQGWFPAGYRRKWCASEQGCLLMLITAAEAELQCE